MAQIGQAFYNPQSGERLVVRENARSTAGQLLKVDVILAPHGHVPAAHVHPAQEERFTIVSGRLRFRAGLKRIIAGAGQTVIVPPGTIHRFTNAGSGEARVILEVRPALRMEDLFETVSELARQHRTLPNGMPRPLDMALFLREFRDELQVPLVPAGLVDLVTAPLAAIAERRRIALPGLAERRSAA